ncbi:hypothetical protein H072_2069 [Dactylellina haptotyla CBS 200.50]|uniref:Uncharacterized protein n=1 Tax=Dactylellina haptotyla (strain CBS 200.50) TaxID=1284197 RepID=S8ALZ8_DACHA|nr:hypothetical protein H072_2069 [Dactylellina haptotyla CBS 200.50]
MTFYMDITDGGSKTGPWQEKEEDTIAQTASKGSPRADLMPAPPSFDAPTTSPYNYNNTYQQQVAQRQAIYQRSQANNFSGPNGHSSGGNNNSNNNNNNGNVDNKSLIGGRYKIYPREL